MLQAGGPTMPEKALSRAGARAAVENRAPRPAPREPPAAAPRSSPPADPLRPLRGPSRTAREVRPTDPSVRRRAPGSHTSLLLSPRVDGGLPEAERGFSGGWLEREDTYRVNDLVACGSSPYLLMLGTPTPGARGADEGSRKSTCRRGIGETAGHRARAPPAVAHVLGSTRRYSFQPSSFATPAPAAVRLTLFSDWTHPAGVIWSVFSRSSVW